MSKRPRPESAANDGKLRELKHLQLRVLIEAVWDVGLNDNMADTDTGIEEALEALQAHGQARIVSRKLLGEPK